MQRAKAFFYVCLGILSLVAAFALGAKTASGQAGAPLTDVAVLTGVLNDGEIIPLPTYSDGTQAPESECHWIVSGNQAYDSNGSYGYNYCYTEGRTVRVFDTVGPIGGKANYIIVATRHDLPIPTAPATWGRIKADRR